MRDSVLDDIDIELNKLTGKTFCDLDRYDNVTLLPLTACAPFRVTESVPFNVWEQRP